MNTPSPANPFRSRARNLRCKHPARMAAFALLGMGVLGVPFAFAQKAPEQPRQETRSEQGREEGKETARRRIEWFHRQRAYPLDHIPGGARLNALEEMNRMLEMEGKLERRPNGEMVQRITPSALMWIPIGPQPTLPIPPQFGGFGNTSGRVTALAVDPTNANTVYLGAAEGGIWKSTDGGTTWNPLTDDKASLAIGSIAVDPSDHNTIYAGTGEENFAIDSYYGAGILKSTDGGANWTLLPGTITNVPGVPSFVGPFLNPISGAVVGGAKIGSLAVSSVPGPSGKPIVLAAVQIFTFDNTSGIYCSDDGGTTWTNVVAGAAATSVVFDPNGTTAYGALGRIFGNLKNGIYKTTMANLSCTAQSVAGAWTRLAGTDAVAPQPSVGRISLALAASRPATLYASIADATRSSNSLLGLFATADAGTTWTKLTATPDFCNAQCWYDNVVAVHPNNASVVYVGGSATSSFFARSTDGGATWAAVFRDSSGNLIHVDQHAMAFGFAPGAPPQAARLYVGNDGGAWSTDVSNPTSVINWSNLNAMLNITQFYPGHSIHPSSEQIGFGGTQDNGSENYTGSLGWMNNLACGDGGWTAIDPLVPSNVYVTCQDIDVEKSVQSGGVNTFNFAAFGIDPSDRGAFIPPFVIDPSTPQRLYFGTFRLWQTVDGANTWSAISTDLTGGGGVLTAIAVAPQRSAVVYTGSSNGRVQVSTNVAPGSGTFNDVSTGLPNRSVTQVVVDPNDVTGNTAYVTFSGFKIGADVQGHIFKTTTGGALWADISGSLPNTPVNDLAVDPEDTAGMTLYIATDVGVFQTSNGGVTWTTLSTGLPNVAVVSLKLREASRTLRAATHGRGVWDLKLPGGAAFGLSSISPATTAAGSASFTLTVNGNGFTLSPQSQLKWNGSTTGISNLSIVSANQLTATVAASLVASAVTAQVTVDQSGGGPISNALPFTVTNPAPTINSNGVQPSSATAGQTQDVNIMVTGTNFNSSSKINWNGSTTGVMNTTFVSATQMTATLSHTLFAFGGVNDVTVVSPPPGGGPSNAALFTVQSTRPVNDDFAAAKNITTMTFSDTVDSFAATTEATDPVPNCAPGSAVPPIKTVWYKFTAGGNGLVIVDTIGSPYDTILTVVTGSPGSFTQVACNDDIVPGVVIQSKLTMNVSTGVTYFFMVSAFGSPPDPPEVGLGGKTVFNFSSTVPAGAPADFAIASAPTSVTINAGDKPTFTITITAQGGTFANAVTLSCSPNPPAPQAQCGFNPMQVQPGNTSATSTLTFLTTARSAASPASGVLPPVRPLPSAWLVFAALALLSAALVARVTKRRRLAVYAPLVVLVLLLVLQIAGCGGGGGGGTPPPTGTPAGSYTVTVTGTSGATQHSTNITVTVR